MGKRYILAVVNLPRTEVHLDKTFESMKALEEYVVEYHSNYTSLVVTVLPV